MGARHLRPRHKRGRIVMFEKREAQCELAVRRLAQDVLDFGDPA